MARAQQALLGDDREYSVEYENGDTVWFVIDTDKWEKEGKIVPLRDCCSKQNASIPRIFDEIKRYDAWNVAQSNPCFEIWLYYHFYEEQPLFDEVEECVSFKDFVDSKISGGFNFDKDPARLEEAIVNARNNFSFAENNTLSLFSSEVYRLGEEIITFVKNDVAKLKNKLG